MHLYHFTIQKQGGISTACCGNFSGNKLQEILVGKGNLLEMYKIDENGKLQSVISVNIFGVIRAVAPFRLTGGTKDYAIVTSDSGRIVILEYNPTKNTFDKVHQETYGKSGIRRALPGHYLSTDPKGRAVMIGSIEKQKLVYILNRDANSRLTISSPLEAHKNHSIMFAMVGVDVGFENPIFATLEVLYEDEEGQSETGQKQLVYYELDLGLNHVTRKWSEPVDQSANTILTVPGGSDGPGGVIVCADNYLYYMKPEHQTIKKAIPRRKGTTRDQGLLIVAHTFHKQKDMFFLLIQSEMGDLYKVNVQYDEDVVNEISIKYFDTVAPANTLCLLKAGFLFVAAEAGNHALYQLTSIGEDEDSAMDIDESEDEFTYFVPHKLKNLSIFDELESLAPLTDLKIADIAKEEMPQLITASGRGVRSTIRVLKHGLTVTEMAAQPLPANPVAVWTIKKALRDEYHKYIVVSFINATLVLQIGESVEEATDSGFLGSASTIHAANIGEDAYLQVHSNGIRHIRGDKRIHEWKTPGLKTIVRAASNERQVVVALSGGDLLYFELDQMGQLIEVDKKFLGTEISCLDIAPIPEGRQRARFLAVGDWDKTVRVFSLDPESTLQFVCSQAVPAHPESLALAFIQLGEGVRELYLSIGLNNGLLLRSAMDTITGELADTRHRLVGTRPVKLRKVHIRGASTVMALSSRTWLCYSHQGQYQMAPFSYQPLDYASTFVSEQCPEGIVAISGKDLRILMIEKLGEAFNTTSIPLLHTPRKFMVHPHSQNIVVIESDHMSYTLREREEACARDSNLVSVEDQRTLGEPRAPFGRWASSVRMIDGLNARTLDFFEMGFNEAAVSMCTCVFKDKDSEVFLVVGTAKDMSLHPAQCTQGFVHIFRMPEGKRLELMHKTPIDGVPTALCAFQGRLLVGVGKALRIYDLGKKKLLRKCESKAFPNTIISLHTQGDRIYAGDVQDSIHFAKYKKTENQIFVFADEPIPRWLTSTAVLDYDTVTGGDKFGNVFVSRLPGQVSDEVEEDPTGSKLKIEQGYLNGAPHKLENLIVFFTGDTVTSVQKSAIAPGGSEAIVYTTIGGAIGALVPFSSREDVDLFSKLEMHLRLERPPLCGREHLAYRSYYFPVKSVYDGDLCEQFSLLDLEKQKQIADELDRTPNEIMKKLEDMRNRLL